MEKRIFRSQLNDSLKNFNTHLHHSSSIYIWYNICIKTVDWLQTTGYFNIVSYSLHEFATRQGASDKIFVSPPSWLRFEYRITYSSTTSSSQSSNPVYPALLTLMPGKHSKPMQIDEFQEWIAFVRARHNSTLLCNLHTKDSLISSYNIYVCVCHTLGYLLLIMRHVCMRQKQSPPIRRAHLTVQCCLLRNSITKSHLPLRSGVAVPHKPECKSETNKILRCGWAIWACIRAEPHTAQPPSSCRGNGLLFVFVPSTSSAHE